jgi:hypothetical protein
VDLLEILRIFAHDFAQISVNLDTANNSLSRIDIWEDHQSRELLIGTLQELGTICVDGELPVTRELVDKIIIALRDPAKVCDNGLLRLYLFDVRSRFIAELRTKLYFQVSSARQAFFDFPRTGWEHVIERFDNTVTDIEEMSKCFALSRYAASVFHSLLVVEHGLVELGRAIGCSDPKAGWDSTCKKMKELLDSGYAKYPTGISISFAALEQVNQCAQSMKFAWRNKVNHAANKLIVLQSDFTPDIAEEIMLATRSFMRRLATDLPRQGNV